MKNFQKILVIIDPKAAQQFAVQRAVQLAQRTGAALHLFLGVYDLACELTSLISKSEKENIKTAVIGLKKKWLDELAEPILRQNIQVTTTVVWQRRLDRAILAEQKRLGSDLLIKTVNMHLVLGEIIHRPIDWNLLRYCPCPVLLVKTPDWQEKPKIIAAVDATAEDNRHAILNLTILDSAKQIANLFEGELHIVNAYPATPAYLPMLASDITFDELQQDLAKIHRYKTFNLAAHYDALDQNVHVIEGSPDYALAKVAKEIGGQLLVLGTVARLGIAGLLIGNTAEDLIDHLNMDILALKADDFISPLDEVDIEC